MRAYGFPGDSKDPSRGVKLLIFGRCYEWLSIKQAERLLESLGKAIRKANGNP